jgi:hypothetical protein
MGTEQIRRIETHCTQCKNSMNVALATYNRFCSRALKNGVKKRATIKCECGGIYMAIETCPKCKGLGEIPVIYCRSVTPKMDLVPRYSQCDKCLGRKFFFKEPEDVSA